MQLDIKLTNTPAGERHTHEKDIPLMYLLTADFKERDPAKYHDGFVVVKGKTFYTAYITPSETGRVAITIAKSGCESFDPI